MATFMVGGGGCQGNDAPYYRAERIDSEGNYILAGGSTDAEAEQIATEMLNEREKFLGRPAIEQLDAIARKSNILTTDVQRAICLINKILQERL